MKEKIAKINDSKIFEEIYCLLLAAITVICWKYNSLIGMASIISIAALSLLILNNFKYMIPCSTYFLFVNNEGFDNSKFPWPLIICGSILILVLVLYTIRNRRTFHISKAKSGKGLALLSISCALPILWHNVIPKDMPVFYLLYLSYLLYFLVYILFASTLEDSFHMCCVAMGYMAVILACECGLKIFELHTVNPEQNILSFWYYLGWGLCNEAGIMMCFGLPFIFISLVKTKHIFTIIFSYLKILIIIVGMLLTTSRGTFIFGSIELLILLLLSIVISKRKIWNLSVLLILYIGVGLFIRQKYGLDVFVSNVKEYIFVNDIDDNGRKELWKRAINLWNQDFVRMTFGSGMCADFYESQSFNGSQIVQIVYHSTLFQIMATMGNLGVAFFIIHLIEKYRLRPLDDRTRLIMIIGFIIVDLYGMIDNTYGMYYYMIPTIIVLGCIDNNDVAEKQN